MDVAEPAQTHPDPLARGSGPCLGRHDRGVPDRRREDADRRALVLSRAVFPDRPAGEAGVEPAGRRLSGDAEAGLPAGARKNVWRLG